MWCSTAPSSLSLSQWWVNNIMSSLQFANSVFSASGELTVALYVQLAYTAPPRRFRWCSFALHSPLRDLRETRRESLGSMYCSEHLFLFRPRYASTMLLSVWEERPHLKPLISVQEALKRVQFKGKKQPTLEPVPLLFYWNLSQKTFYNSCIKPLRDLTVLPYTCTVFISIWAVSQQQSQSAAPLCLTVFLKIYRQLCFQNTHA